MDANWVIWKRMPPMLYAWHGKTMVEPKIFSRKAFHSQPFLLVGPFWPGCIWSTGTLLMSVSASQIRILYDGPRDKMQSRSSNLADQGSKMPLSLNHERFRFFLFVVAIMTTESRVFCVFPCGRKKLPRLMGLHGSKHDPSLSCSFGLRLFHRAASRLGSTDPSLLWGGAAGLLRRRFCLGTLQITNISHQNGKRKIIIFKSADW